MKVAKLILLQAFWYFSVRYGNTSPFWLFWVSSILLGVGNYFLFPIRMRFQRYFELMVFFLGCGFIHDLLLIKFSLVDLGSDLPTLWMNGLWVIFLCYYDLFEYLKKKDVWLLAMMGFVAAPFSYWSGTKLSGGLILNIWFFCLYVGVFWGVFFPVSLKLYYKK